MNFAEEEGKFRELLDTEYSWPAYYTFKFVVPTRQIKEVETLFEARAEVKLKESSAGKYTSVTIVDKMPNADSIIEVYRKASQIEGIISL